MSTEYYIGVDVGGTKIYAAMTDAAGQIVSKKRNSTPHGGTRSEVIETILKTVEKLIKKSDVGRSQIAGIGLAVPGMVDFKRDMIVESPNIALSGENLVKPIEAKFGVPVALANDVDAGAMGEFQFGSNKNLQSLVGIFVGTGIGGGVIIDGRIHHGRRFSAAEIGHMSLFPDGRLCGCGLRGCFEAHASRTAIEAAIRQALADGRESAISELTDLEQPKIRSGALAKAIAADDPLIKETLTAASETIGRACLTIFHLLNPEAIVLGGGVMEACGEFMLPTVKEVVAQSPFIRHFGGQIILSTLGDDAGVLGAAAIGMQAAGDARKSKK